MIESGKAAEGVRQASSTRELEILNTITGGIASFGAAVRGSALTSEQKSQVLACLAEASGSMMTAINAYLFELGAARRRSETAASAAETVSA